MEVRRHSCDEHTCFSEDEFESCVSNKKQDPSFFPASFVALPASANCKPGSPLSRVDRQSTSLIPRKRQEGIIFQHFLRAASTNGRSVDMVFLAVPRILGQVPYSAAAVRQSDMGGLGGNHPLDPLWD